jgi:hypothetical protein
MGTSSASGVSNTLESQLFKITSNVWRFSWEAKLSESSNRVMFQVYRYTGNQPDGGAKLPSMPIGNLAGLTGGRVMSTGPGVFFLKVIGAGEATVKVEEQAKKEKEPAK